jgi:hypothetical protein
MVVGQFEKEPKLQPQKVTSDSYKDRHVTAPTNLVCSRIHDSYDPCKEAA